MCRADARLEHSFQFWVHICGREEQNTKFHVVFWGAILANQYLPIG